MVRTGTFPEMAVVEGGFCVSLSGGPAVEGLLGVSAELAGLVCVHAMFPINRQAIQQARNIRDPPV